MSPQEGSGSWWMVKWTNAHICMWSLGVKVYTNPVVLWLVLLPHSTKVPDLNPQWPAEFGVSPACRRGFSLGSPPSFVGELKWWLYIDWKCECVPDWLFVFLRCPAMSWQHVQASLPPQSHWGKSDRKIDHFAGFSTQIQFWHSCLL